jgi:flagellar basal body-associated protein FliL
MEVDPNLVNSLKDLANDFTNVKDDIESLTLDGDGSVDESIPFREKIRLRYKKVQKYFKNQATSLAYSLKYFLIWLFTDGIKKVLQFFSFLFRLFKKFFEQFSSWSSKKKMGFVLSFSGLALVGFGFFYVVKSRLLYKESYKFYGSMGDVASYVFHYDPESQSEAFYSSPRVKTYSFRLKPIVINLKRKENSDRNPMGFFEFVLDGSSGDVLVEVKTRETEIVDIVQRVIEGMRYEELDTQDGKLLLKETLRKELNKILLEGSLRKVQIQSIIIKP